MKKIILGLLVASGLIVITSLTSSAAKLDDAEILGVLSAINENEVNIARQAINNADADQQVRDYATKMEQAHSENLDQTLSVSQQIGVTPAEDAPEVQKQREKGQKEVSRLESLSGEKFSKEFMQCMVKSHKDALKIIEKKLMESAQSDQVKNHLSATRDHISAHLEEAKQIQQAL